MTDPTRLTRRSLLALAPAAALAAAPRPAFAAAADGPTVHQIEDFGATGDGKADDTPAFTAFRAAALKLRGGVTLNLSAGRTYMVSDPYWPRDIPLLTVNGNGAALKNNATINVNKALLVPSYGTQKGGLGTFYAPVPRFLIASTEPGETRIATLRARDAANFAPGEWVMIASLDIQYYGQPPNYRFFEYAEVAAVDTATGGLTLRQPLRYPHQSDFPYTEYEQGDGRASIYKIEQGALWNIDHTYNDIRFVQNDVDAAGAVSQAVYCTGRRVTFKRCTSRWFLVSCAGTVTLDGCTQTRGGEIDKLTETLILNDCEFRGMLDSATSVGTLRATRTRFIGGYTIVPRRLELIDCTVTASSQNKVRLRDGYDTTDEVIITGGSHQYLPFHSLQANIVPTVTLGEGGVAWDEAAKTLSMPITKATRQFSKRLHAGQLVSVSVANAGSRVSTGNFGRVTKVTGGLGVARAQIDWTAPLTGTEQITCFNEPRSTRIDTGGVSRDYVSVAHTRFRLQDQLVTSGWAAQNVPVFGRLTRLALDVKRPYSGPDNAATLTIQNLRPSFARIINLAVDLRRPGLRESSLSGNRGWFGTGGESAARNLPDGAFTDTAFGSMSLTASPMPVDDVAELPVIDVTMAFESPYNAG